MVGWGQQRISLQNPACVTVSVGDGEVGGGDNSETVFRTRTVHSQCGIESEGMRVGTTANQYSEPGLCTVSVGEGGEGDERWMVGHRLGGS